ncbi:MAG TPA: hypothetical protein VFW14_10500 [Gaiellales bacterium]|nr:hypothetical protein [Gaiellales bacterium]
MGADPRSARRYLAGQRWALQSRWAGHPSYLAYSRRRHPLAVLRAETELVIEAYPRSANTFSAVAFQTSQPGPVRLAHHLHAPAQIVAGARRGIPVLVPVRRPRDCAISVAIRSPYVSLAQALEAYRRFHEAILAYRDACQVALFEDVTTDFGRVVETLNAKFGTGYVPFAHTPENVERVYALIEERARQPVYAPVIHAYVCGLITSDELEVARRRARPGAADGAAGVERRVARPSSERRDLQERLGERYREPGLARLREAAESAYRRFAFGDSA